MKNTSSTIHYIPGAQKTVSMKTAFIVFAGTIAAAVAVIMASH
jgi:hypothetical protein